MLPGVGIFGYDPVSKVLIQLLRHFGFEIHAIWTNSEEFDDIGGISSNGGSAGSVDYTNDDEDTSSSSLFFDDDSLFSEKNNLLTNSIDNVLLNKNVNLIFVCCQPSLHSQICSKALGIGKNVICCSPTCKDEQNIQQMLNSAYYYPTLMSSINYGGLRYLNEYKQMKESIKCIGDVKLCNITINCKNINSISCNTPTSTATTPTNNSDMLNNNHETNDLLLNNNYNLLTDNNDKHQVNGKTRQLNDSTLTDKLKYHKLLTKIYSHWHADKNLGAGVLNRFGSAIISLVMYLFDDRKISKVNGCVKTLVETLNGDSTTSHGRSSTNTNNKNDLDEFYIKMKTKQITADDYCNFQLNLEPNEIIVNVTINSLVSCKYEQEISICGTKGSLVLNNLNSKLILRPSTTSTNTAAITTPSSNSSSFTVPSSLPNTHSTNLIPLSTQSPIEFFDDNFELLNKYKIIEDYHPELPYIYIKGLYSYIKLIKEKFLNNENLNENIDNFEHTRIVQLIVQNIYESSLINKWVTIRY